MKPVSDIGNRTFVFFLFFAVCIFSCSAQRKQILVFSKTLEYRHQSIPVGIDCIKKISKDLNIAVDTTENSSYFTSENLSQYVDITLRNMPPISVCVCQRFHFKMCHSGWFDFVSICAIYLVRTNLKSFRFVPAWRDHFKSSYTVNIAIKNDGEQTRCNGLKTNHQLTPWRHE